jgi:hypothetical protein
MNGSNLSNHIFANFEIDGSGQRLNASNVQPKGIIDSPLTHGRFFNLSVHDTSATGLGIDYGSDVYITNSYFSHDGAQAAEISSAGHACIGNGTGALGEMPEYIAGNTLTDCGNNAIFIENEYGYNSAGVRIEGNSCAWAGGGAGICYGDTGGSGTIISGNQARYSRVGINVQHGLGSPTTYPVDWLIANNVLQNLDSPITVTVDSSTGKIQGNEISGGLSISNSGAIVVLGATGNAAPIEVSGNMIHDYPGYGIQFGYSGGGGVFNAVTLIGNHIWNMGVSGTPRSAIYLLTGTISKLAMSSNVAYDNRSPQYQTYGFQNAGTITELDDNNNQFTGNLTAPELLAGTITTRYVNGELQGSTALATSALTAGTCQTITAGSVNSAAVANATASSIMRWGPAVSLQTVVGYQVSTVGNLSIDAYPNAGYINFNVCNNTASSITPGALTINWSVRP